MQIIEVIVPAKATDETWQAYVGLVSEHDREMLGTDEWEESPAQALARATADQENRFRRFVARIEGVPVGYASHRVNVVDDPLGAEVGVFVSADHRGRGVATALAQKLATAIHPRTERLEAWIFTPLPDGEALPSPVGVGAVDADHPGVRMALKYGFRLGQVERISRYDFANPAVDPHVVSAEARAVAQESYDLVRWRGATPELHLADMARLLERMDTDAPSGELTVNAATWTPERVRERDARHMATMVPFVTAVIHRATGHVVGFSELMVPLEKPEGLVDQWDTIVLQEHRGYRLGWWLKAANIVQVREAMPGATGIVTFNAEENRHILSVNEALGFIAIGAEGGFERKLRTEPIAEDN